MSAVPNPQNQNPLVAAVASVLPSITKAEEPKQEPINLQPQPAASAPVSKPKPKRIIPLGSIRNESDEVKPKEEKVGTWDEQVRKAKDNLVSRHDKKPSAADVASLAGLRYHGKDNAEFLEGYNTRKGEEAEAEPEPETKTKSKRVKPVRVTAEAGTQEEKLANFFKNRVKNPAQFTYTPEGDLRIQGVEGVADSTIVLKPYTALKPEELKELEDKRLEALVILEEEYEATLTELRATHESYKSGETGAARVVEVNQKLRDVTLKISQAAYPERWITYVNNPEIKKILLGEIYEHRKLGYDVSIVKRSDFSRQDVWGRYRDESQIQEQNQQSGGSNDVIFIEDEETPFHPAFMREFVYEETRYVSPYQAYQAERFKELDLPEIKNQILKTRSARTIHNIAAKEPTDAKYPKELWEQILEAYYTQHKDLATRLKDTGSKRFHLSEAMYANQNYLDALLATRVMLRESGDIQKEIKEVKQGVITEEQQKRDRAGAIANFRRH